jgi:hypothetical protein
VKGKPKGYTFWVKEMEKFAEEWIYPKEGKKIPQETSRIVEGEPWSSGITLASPELGWRRKWRE